MDKRAIEDAVASGVMKGIFGSCMIAIGCYAIYAMGIVLLTALFG